MRALLTGANGFLGGHLGPMLAEQGAEVWALGRRCPAWLAPLRFLPLAAVEDGTAIAATLRRLRPEFVFHLAGTRAPALADAVNHRYARHLLAGAAALDAPPRLILMGSASEYGAIPEAAQPVTESAVCNPATPYGKAKLAQTEAGLAAARAGLPVVVARLFNAVGAGMPEELALGAFAAQLRTGAAELVSGRLDAVRDFVPAAAVAAVLAELVRLPAAMGRVVNLCSGQGATLEPFVAAFLAAAGRPVTWRLDPKRGLHGPPSPLYGNPARLHSLGLHLPPAEPARVAMELLG